jgi:hypothetical protein
LRLLGGEPGFLVFVPPSSFVCCVVRSLTLSCLARSRRPKETPRLDRNANHPFSCLFRPNLYIYSEFVVLIRSARFSLFRRVRASPRRSPSPESVNSLRWKYWVCFVSNGRAMLASISKSPRSCERRPVHFLPAIEISVMQHPTVMAMRI